MTEPTGIQLHFTKDPEEEEDVQTCKHTRARHTKNIIGDSEQRDKVEENRRTETKIDMTVEDSTESRSHTHTCPAMNPIEIIELNDDNNQEEARYAVMGRQADYRESDDWQDQNITHLETTTQRAHAIPTATGDKTLEFPRGMQGTAQLNTVTAAQFRDKHTIRLGDETIYLQSMLRLKHYRQLGNDVIDIYLKQFAIKTTGLKVAAY